jgi:hypothetical protein
VAVYGTFDVVDDGSHAPAAKSPASSTCGRTSLSVASRSWRTCTRATGLSTGGPRSG